MSIDVPNKKWHVFISHASEDKELIARPLCKILEKEGLKVWLDENELKLGDSLAETISQGIASSDFGIVILSKVFLSKDWPKRELNSLVSLETANNKKILPVWHNITHDEVKLYSPLLADKFAISTDEGFDKTASAIIKAINTECVKNYNKFNNLRSSNIQDVELQDDHIVSTIKSKFINKFIMSLVLFLLVFAFAAIVLKKFENDRSLIETLAMCWATPLYISFANIFSSLSAYYGINALIVLSAPFFVGIGSFFCHMESSWINKYFRVNTQGL